MADNYIEKQYERYLARKAAWEKERKLGKRKTNNSYSGKLGKEDTESINRQEGKKSVLVTDE